MKKYILALSTIAILSCCAEKKEKPILNKKQFESMLIDIHLADGTLSAENVYRSGRNYRPSYYYNSVFKKYNITPLQWDSCVAYYAANTLEFTKTYDKIIDSLNRLETQYRIKIKKAKLEQDTVNLWTRKTAWKVPQDGNPSFYFSIPVSEKGIYTITADVKVYPDDQNESPKIEAYFWKRDSLGNIKKAEFPTIMLSKDGAFRTYRIELEYPDSTYTFLRGNLFATKNNFSQFTQHYEIKHIQIFNPAIKADTTFTKQDEVKRAKLEALELR